MRLLLSVALLVSLATLTGCEKESPDFKDQFRDYDGNVHIIKLMQMNEVGNMVVENFYDDFDELKAAICKIDTRDFPVEPLKIPEA